MKRVGNLTLLKMFLPYSRGVSFKFSWYAYKNFKFQNPQRFNNKIWINTNLPSYPSESFNRYMDVLLNQKRRPQYAYFAITSKCPFKCPFCSYGRRIKKDLKTEQILDIIQQLKELDSSVFGITGGEPLLRNDLEEIIKAVSPEMSSVLFTTGYKLTKDRAKKIADAGICCVIIGLEFSDPEKQDKIKGLKGSFEYAKKAIELFNDLGIFTSFNTIATKEKIKTGELQNIYNLAKIWNVCEVRYISPIATGSWTGNIDEMLGPSEYQYLKDFQINKNKKHKPPIVTWLSYYETPELFGCLTGYQYIYIDSSGEVCPCDLSPLSFGNVTKEPLNKIWTRMGETFKQPRSNCLIQEIAKYLDNEKLPLPPNKSKKIVPELKSDAKLPIISKYLTKK